MRVSVYVNNEKERSRAKEILKNFAGQINEYDGLITASADQPTLKQLMESGFMVDRSSVTKKAAGLTGLVYDRVSEIAHKVFKNFTDQSPQRYRIKLSGPLSETRRKQLEEQEVSIVEARGIDEYVTFLTPGQFHQLKKVDYVLKLDVDDTLKVSRKSSAKPAVFDGELKALEVYDIYIYLDVHGGRKNLEAKLKKISQVRIEEEIEDAFRVSIPANAVEKLYSAIELLPQVKSIREYAPPTLLCNAAQKVIGFTSGHNDLPWKGKGEIIGVLDSGIQKDHIDFQNAIIDVVKMTGADDGDFVGHGTHVAGIIGGRGAASGGQVMGVAPESKLVVVNMIDDSNKLILPLDIRKLLAPAVEKGARILNLSWGWPIGGEYDQITVKIDEFVYENPEVLIVVAAGNSGQATNGNHNFRTIAAPATGKNIITVGACSSECDQMTCQRAASKWSDAHPGRFPVPPAANELVCAPPLCPAAISSRGPTIVGTVKPDVLAPGTLIESTRSVESLPTMYTDGCVIHGDKYAVASGTSMAAPFVSGCAAIIRQYLREKMNLDKPSSALIKAFLILSASEIRELYDKKRFNTTGYPDFDQGFGVVNMGNLFGSTNGNPKKFLIRDIPRTSQDALASRMPVNSPIKSSYQTTINILPGSDFLRIALVWIDYPGVYIQNNLQLNIRKPDGVGLPGNNEHLYYKNDPLLESNDLAGIPFDKINNVELIRIENPPAGEYTLRVSAENTSRNNQGYALVVFGHTNTTALN